MKPDLPKALSGSMSSVKLNDCWNKIGVWGNRECGELKHLIHCRNCIVYSSAAAQLLGGELPKDYLEGWTTHFATEVRVESHSMQAALIFRIGAEWLALSPTNLQEIAEDRPAHSVPQARSSILLGLANIRGELLVCVALDQLLGLEKIGPEPVSSKRAIYRRLVVAGREGSRFVFPVDEVHGICRFSSDELTGVPSTVAKAHTTYLRGILPWQNKSVGCLDDQLLFDMLDRSLT
ncbi:MAG TPA: chemotaxis protein CheW [Chthoniobacterales bacterium]|nr:chemotaxis protein CheW [Chthoniobacterales bacterium]